MTWEHSVRTTWLLNWTYIHALRAAEDSYQHNACHRFLLLVFGTLLAGNLPALDLRVVKWISLAQGPNAPNNRSRSNTPINIECVQPECGTGFSPESPPCSK
ncbi:hypothetical protein CRG98_012087 [Punica granatum]|uniref:Uncharacterized protein n=1 Tax=Punica granatum TaxID=22663 RepID=A0A2I0KH21_PUNGR|nr:hypothetical protein CRG98_012087 [Punica granatum]